MTAYPILLKQYIPARGKYDVDLSLIFGMNWNKTWWDDCYRNL